MLTTVDRVIARLTFKHPVADLQGGAACDDAAQFAARLLENYKAQLAERSLEAARTTPPSSS